MANQAPSTEKQDLQQTQEESRPVQERRMPQAIDAERSVLGAIMRDPVMYMAKAEEEKVTRAHFYLPAHGEVFETLVYMYSNGIPIEEVSMVQLLTDRNKLDFIGGVAKLAEIEQSSAAGAFFDYHVQLVKDKFILRSVIMECEEAIKRAFDDQEEVPSLVDGIEQKILNIRNENDSNDQLTIKQAAEMVMSEFGALVSGEKKQQGISTGYQVLDRMTSGLKPTEMFVVAARPSMGKTSFMMNLVEHVALDQSLPTMVFSCEMSSTQIVQRLIFARARTALSKFQKGIKPTKADIQKINRAVSEISTAHIFVDDTAGISINELRAKARRRHKETEGGLKLIAIDYLQLLKSTSKQAQNAREREIAEISSGIKALAKELNLPVIILAQLNRGPENRGGTPRMSDLRESGAIEQDADLVGLLYRTAYYAESEEEKEREAGKSELVLAKNRNGETGFIPLSFIPELMRFETRAREEGEQEPE